MKTLDQKKLAARDPDQFVRWLNRRGKTLAELRLTTADGERMVKVVRRGKNAVTSCTYTAKTALLLEPSRVEALDEKGTLLGIFDFPDPDLATEVPGYVHDDADSSDERLLKTFAHLLADAHKLANQRLVDVLGLQSAHHAEERKALAGSLYSLERTMQRMAKMPLPRMRVEAPDDDDADPDDPFAPMIAEMVQRAVSGKPAAAPAPAPHANGKGPTDA